MLVLVDTFSLKVWQISLILLVSGLVNFLGSPYLGRLLDRLGERWVMTSSYLLLTLCCVGFAMLHQGLAAGRAAAGHQIAGDLGHRLGYLCPSHRAARGTHSYPFSRHQH